MTERGSPGGVTPFVEALLHQLHASGVVDLCICPGSRSTPIVTAARAVDGVRIWHHIDERSAAFFALGLAVGRRRPVAVAATSGTAVANLLPAVVEASRSGVPLIVLTADRPPELRDWGANQTILQPGIFARFVRWETDAAVPGEGTTGGYGRALAARAVAVATGRPPGPVHLNLPFRKPLEPDAPPIALPPPATVIGGDLVAPPAARDALTDAIGAARRGVVVAGPARLTGGGEEALGRFAARLGWPVVADVLSPLRTGAHTREVSVIAAHDAVLRSPGAAEVLRPDVVIHTGAAMTSAAAVRWESTAHRIVVLDHDGIWSDPDHRADLVLRAGLDDALLDVPVAGADPDWTAEWRRADEAAAAVLAEPADRLVEPDLVRAVAAATGEGDRIFVSNSMPVREFDSFLPASERRIEVLGQRGASGIDGITSTALGVAAASPGRTILVTGDLAFLHDVGGLFAARRHGPPLTIVVIDNGGGAIFGYLPVAGVDDSRVRVEEDFLVPPGLDDLGAFAGAYRIPHRRVDTASALAHALTDPPSGPLVVVVPIDAAASIAFHRDRWRRAADAVAALLAGT